MDPKGLTNSSQALFSLCTKVIEGFVLLLKPLGKTVVRSEQNVSAGTGSPERPRTLTKEGRKKEQKTRKIIPKDDRFPCDIMEVTSFTEHHHFCLLGAQRHNKPGHYKLSVFGALPFPVQMGKVLSDFFPLSI